MSDTPSNAAAKRPPRQSRTGLTATGARKAASKSTRTPRARVCAARPVPKPGGRQRGRRHRSPSPEMLAGFSKADAVHFDALLHGCVAEAASPGCPASPRCWIAPLSRDFAHRARDHVDRCLRAEALPGRAMARGASNECVELAKEFGGTDGHKIRQRRAERQLHRSCALSKLKQNATRAKPALSPAELPAMHISVTRTEH